MGSVFEVWLRETRAAVEGKLPLEATVCPADGPLCPHAPLEAAVDAHLASLDKSLCTLRKWLLSMGDVSTPSEFCVEARRCTRWQLYV